MRYLLTALVIFLCTPVVIAQQSNVQYSDPIIGWEESQDKILQLKNGNTFHLHFFYKTGLEATIYGPDRKKKSRKPITGIGWDVKKTNITNVEGIYEIGNDVVLFIQHFHNRAPTLYRVIIDGETAAKKDDRKISTLPRIGAGAGYAMYFGGVDPSKFYIEKDPGSDCYAVVNFNGFARESGERIEAVHYNGNHEVINKAFYDSPDSQFKYLRYIGMTVLGDKQLFLCSYGFNTMTSGGKDSRIIVSRLNKNETQFTHKLLEFSDDFKDTRAVMQYNPYTNTIHLLTLTLLKEQNKAFRGKVSSYQALISYIDPQSLSIITTKQLTAENADTYAAKNLDSKDGFSGMLQQLYIHPDNTSTVVMEEMNSKVTTAGRSTIPEMFLGNIGITELDERGTEKGGYAIWKSQTFVGKMKPLYLSQKVKGLCFHGYDNDNENRFTSFDFIPTSKGKYVIFNDYSRNFEEPSVRKRKRMSKSWESNAVCYLINKGGQIDKFYLFGQPEDEKTYKYAFIASSDFNQQTSTYATVLIDDSGKKPLAKIAWVKFE